MSRTVASADPAAAAARAELPQAEAAAFDRLVAAVTRTRSAPLTLALRAPLPGTGAGRWLRSEGLAPTTPVAALTSAQWGSLYRFWVAAGGAGTPRGATVRQSGGRPSSTHGHGPGAQAAPRWF